VVADAVAPGFAVGLAVAVEVPLADAVAARRHEVGSGVGGRVGTDVDVGADARVATGVVLVSWLAWLVLVRRGILGAG
jgi:hypothetical protein